jgi:hypothetical protein
MKVKFSFISRSEDRPPTSMERLSALGLTVTGGGGPAPGRSVPTTPRPVLSSPRPGPSVPSSSPRPGSSIASSPRPGSSIASSPRPGPSSSSPRPGPPVAASSPRPGGVANAGVAQQQPPMSSLSTKRLSSKCYTILLPC